MSLIEEVRKKLHVILEVRNLENYEIAIEFLVEQLEKSYAGQDKQIEGSGEQGNIDKEGKEETDNLNKESENQPNNIVEEKQKCEYYEGFPVPLVESKEEPKIDESIEKSEKQIKNEKKAQKEKRVDLKGLQETIHIYHQCLSKIIKSLCCIFMKLPLFSYPNDKIGSKIVKKMEKFWEDYDIVFKNNKKFHEVIKNTKGILAEKFLTALSGFEIGEKEIYKSIIKEPWMYSYRFV